MLLNDFNYEVKKNIEISTHLFCINLIIYLYIWMYYMQWHFFVLDEKDSRKERIKSKVSSISNVKKEKQYHKINQLQVTHIWISFSLSVKKIDCMSKVKQSFLSYFTIIYSCDIHIIFFRTGDFLWHVELIFPHSDIKYTEKRYVKKIV